MVFVQPTTEPFVCYTKPRGQPWKVYDKLKTPFLNECLVNLKIMHGVSFVLLFIGKSMHLCSAGNNTYPYMSIVNFFTIPLYIGVVFQAEHFIRLS